LFSVLPVQHTYTADSSGQPNGSYPVQVTIRDDDGDTLQTTAPVAVVPPPILMHADNVAEPPGVLSVNNAEVADFTVPSSTATASEFVATVNWGDGATSSGSIQQLTNGLFQVLGSHTYAVPGLYDVTTTVKEIWQSIQKGAVAAGQAVGQAAIQVAKALTGPFGPTVVPSLSQYTYTVNALPFTNVQWLAPNGGAAIVGPANKASVTIKFGPGPSIVDLKAKANGLLVEMKITDVFVDVTNKNFTTTAPTNTPAVQAFNPNAQSQFQVDPNDAKKGALVPNKGDPNPGWVLTHTPGSNFKAFTFTGKAKGTEKALLTRTKTALNTGNVNVELTLPAKANLNDIKQIEVGFIQHDTDDGTGTYQNKKRRQYFVGGKAGLTVTGLDWYDGSTLQAFNAGQNYLKKQVILPPPATDVWPWYDPATGNFTPAKAAKTDTGPISMTDSPSFRVPRFFDGLAAAPKIPLLNAALSNIFDLSIAARTKQAGADNHFFAEYQSQWTVNYNVMVNNKGGYNAAVGGLAQNWSKTNAPTELDVNLVPAGAAANYPYRTWD
jgi:hypothetical protein